MSKIMPLGNTKISDQESSPNNSQEQENVTECPDPQMSSAEWSQVKQPSLVDSMDVIGPYTQDAIFSSADWWMVFLTIAIILVSSVTVYVTHSQLRASKKAHYGSILLELLDRYSSVEMLESLAQLRKFGSEREPFFSELGCLYTCVRDGSPISKEAELAANRYNKDFEPEVGKQGTIGEHRARVAWFFAKASRLYNAGLIDKKTFQIVCELDAAGVFLKVAVPATLAIRFEKIHKFNVQGVKSDPNVGWYAEIERAHRERREDLEDLY